MVVENTAASLRSLGKLTRITGELTRIDLRTKSRPSLKHTELTTANVWSVPRHAN